MTDTPRKTTFTDAENRTWDAHVNVNAVKRVQRALDVDLMSVIEKPELLERLATDPVLLIDVLYVICQPQAERAGVSDEQFGAAFSGDTIDGAIDALMAGLIGFFPRDRRRVLTAIAAKLDAVNQRAADWAMTKLEDPTLNQDLEQQLDQAWAASVARPSSGSSSNAPASSESTPAP